MNYLWVVEYRKVCGKGAWHPLTGGFQSLREAKDLYRVKVGLKSGMEFRISKYQRVLREVK